MQITPTRAVFDVITDFLASEPTPQQIVDYLLPADLQERADDLAERNAEGQLTYEERAELETFINADQMFSLLKTKMKRKLNQR